MRGALLEACWAFNKLWNNKFYYKAASCWYSYFYWIIHDARIHEYQKYNQCQNPHWWSPIISYAWGVLLDRKILDKILCVVDNINMPRFLNSQDITHRLVNPLNGELNPICYLLALLGAHHFLHVSRIRVKSLTFRLLMSYIYIYMCVCVYICVYIYMYIYIYIYIPDISSLRVNTSAHCSGRKQVKG